MVGNVDSLSPSLSPSLMKGKKEETDFAQMKRVKVTKNAFVNKAVRKRRFDDSGDAASATTTTIRVP